MIGTSIGDGIASSHAAIRKIGKTIGAMFSSVGGSSDASKNMTCALLMRIADV